VVARSAGGGATPSLPSVFVTNGEQGEAGTISPELEPYVTPTPSPFPTPSPTAPASDAPATQAPTETPSSE
jgi:hypothetical protein